MAPVEEEVNEEAPDFDDPLALLGGMGEEQVYQVTAVPEAGGSSDEALPAFLREIELFLLDLEASAPLPELPGELGGEGLQADCAALRRLAGVARAGDLEAVLRDEWLADVFGKALAREAVEEALAEGVPQLRFRLQGACAAFAGAAPPGAAAARGAGLLLVAVASLQLYMRANWTGPATEDLGPFAAPQGVDGAQQACPPATLRMLDELEIDGEPAYEMLAGPGLLWLALELLGGLRGAQSQQSCGSAASARTAPIWRGRAAFAWQLSLAEASERGIGQSPSLFQRSVCDLVGAEGRCGALSGRGLLTGEVLGAARTATGEVLKAWRPRGGQAAGGGAEDEASAAGTSAAEAEAAASVLADAPGRVRAALVVELAVRLCWYGRTKPFDGVLASACSAIGFNFEVTGVMGIKRVYQTVEFAQLMCKAGGTENEAAQSDNTAKDGALPDNLQLLSVDDQTDVLEGPKVSKDVDDEDRAKLEKPLTAAEQLILLAKCHWLWVSFNPNDEMTLQEVNALAQRVLKTEASDGKSAEGDSSVDGPLLTANWLNFSTGLWYRCKAEHHRNKTRERATFQLQSLVDQFNDEKPSAGHRLLVAHSAGYPARFHLQREMGMRMMRMGMVSTAHEQFKKLKMWPEAVECLMVAERNVEAEEMIKEQLDIQPTPRLWCCLGEILKEPKHFEAAWELSGKRFARAMRSLGRHHFMKGDLDKAVDCFKRAVDINPLHGGIWFTMGVAEMRLQRFEAAVFTFSRCVSVEDENSEAWANLAAVHSQLGNLKEARTCMNEGCRRNRNSWKMWESFLGICMQLRDIQGVIQSLRQLAELDQTARIQERILGMVTMAVVSDAQGLYNGTTGKAFADQLNTFYKFLTSKYSSLPFVWRFWAELQDSRGERRQALESRLKQNRAAQAKLWEERDPEQFGEMLRDLRECFDTVGDTLAEPGFEELAREQLSGLSFSVRAAAGRLAAKLDAGLSMPAAWREEHAKIDALAAKLEARVAEGAS